jgi:branched-chain amino acid transport system ATP-binding protein
VLRELHREGLATFVVEQNAYAALRFAERGYVFEDGRVTKAAPAAALLGDPHLVESYVGSVGRVTSN